MTQKIKSKPCSKCKAPRRLSFFGVESRAKDGLRSECKLCQYKTIRTSIDRKILKLEGEKNG